MLSQHVWQSRVLILKLRIVREIRAEKLHLLFLHVGRLDRRQQTELLPGGLSFLPAALGGLRLLCLGAAGVFSGPAPGPRCWRRGGGGDAVGDDAEGSGAGQWYLSPAGLPAPPAAAALGAPPVLLVVGQRLLLSVVLLLLLALQKDVVAAGSCRENVLKDVGRWMLEVVFVINVQLIYFQTQD